LIYQCGGIDKRTIEKFEKVSAISSCFLENFFFRSHGVVVLRLEAGFWDMGSEVRAGCLVRQSAKRKFLRLTCSQWG
jgi:hypothetical protein